MRRRYEIIQKITKFCPYVPPPEKEITFKEKCFWSILILFTYVVLFFMPVYGMSSKNNYEVFFRRSEVNPVQGTLMEIGFSPFLTIGMFFSILSKSGIFAPDSNSKEEVTVHNQFMKFIGLSVTLFQAIFMVSNGSYGPLSEIGIIKRILIVAQLFFSGLSMCVLDEFLAKGYGFGESAMTVYFAFIPAESLFWKLFAPIRKTIIKQLLPTQVESALSDAQPAANANKQVEYLGLVPHVLSVWFGRGKAQTLQMASSEEQKVSLLSRILHRSDPSLSTVREVAIALLHIFVTLFFVQIKCNIFAVHHNTQSDSTKSESHSSQSSSSSSSSTTTSESMRHSPDSSDNKSSSPNSLSSIEAGHSPKSTLLVATVPFFPTAYLPLVLFDFFKGLVDTLSRNLYFHFVCPSMISSISSSASSADLSAPLSFSSLASDALTSTFCSTKPRSLFAFLYRAFLRPVLGSWQIDRVTPLGNVISHPTSGLSGLMACPALTGAIKPAASMTYFVELVSEALFIVVYIVAVSCYYLPFMDTSVEKLQEDARIALQQNSKENRGKKEKSENEEGNEGEHSSGDSTKINFSQEEEEELMNDIEHTTLIAVIISSLYEAMFVILDKVTGNTINISSILQFTMTVSKMTKQAQIDWQNSKKHIK
ncbi:putative Secretory protein 61 B (Sec61B) [Monocercomonoides exilis]|uniref:putative Secretory protein 61 B (Sec61B) n=1 Tax=Monocercomonoides exilis TaxID=2049356 RepID=UPI0035594C97|nr:putative Secretory protein 61 B (Sec61B) [Monocercomonoides exilis]|eukprot:MONOS_16824.1-p1 / transcript=MONOS_16824.1 / gene=MONOS_16824 / organism=Monocercomonoides_exilis_PA203 / gene_product=Secretory protein 61 B (Sec61B) / transcript_product=Secretory protein 61 B (Sec61B) / location=Mono_scaffold00060:13063-15344(-) / protein_length=650 / sequence_SO=supercontig / SO=protein_coding / is_pseudo=false